MPGVVPVTLYRGILSLAYFKLIEEKLPVSQTYDIPKYYKLSGTFLLDFIEYFMKASERFSFGHFGIYTPFLISDLRKLFISLEFRYF